MEADRQLRETTLKQLRALLEAQTALRKAAEEQARMARAELERVAEALCPGEVDRLRCESPQGLSALSPRQVADLILRHRPVLHVPGEASLLGEQVEAKARLADLQRRLRAALERAARAEEEAAFLRARLQALEAPEGAACAPSDPSRWELVRMAADLLAAAGYAVERAPAPLALPDGAAFLPDLLVRQEDRILPVEVEDLRRSSEEREARWEICYRLTGGHLYFVTPDPRRLDRVRSEVFYWVGPRPLTLHMTDLERGRGRRGETVWVVRRTMRCPPS